MTKIGPGPGPEGIQDSDEWRVAGDENRRPKSLRTGQVGGDENRSRAGARRHERQWRLASGESRETESWSEVVKVSDER